MKKRDVQIMNTTALAYLGDAVYEVAIRKFIMGTGQRNADRLHQIAVRYVRAEGQAKAMKRLMEELTEEELDLVRRARNHKITSSPRKVDPFIYKLATAFEAFVGYLYLIEDKQRLDWFIEQAIRAIDEHEGRPLRQKDVKSG